MSGTALVVLRIAVSFAVALASFALIEQPIRLKRAFRPVVVLAAVCVPIVLLGVARLDGPVAGGLEQAAPSVGEVISLDGATDATTAGPTPPAAPDDGSAGPSSATDASSPAATAPAGRASADGVADAVAPTTDPTRLLLFGDSVAFTLEQNLRDDSLPFPVAEQRVGEFGCGIIDGYAVVPDSLTGPNANCADWRDDLAGVVSSLDPDVVVMVLGAWDVFDVVVDGVELDAGTAEHSARFEASLRDAVEIAAAQGAAVVLFDVPCFAEPDHSVQGSTSPPRNDPARGAALNVVIRAVAEELGATVLPYHDLLCDGDEPRLLDGEAVRYDGVHFRWEGGVESRGGRFVWQWLGQELLDRGIVAAP
jgi:hypothetical protein